MGNKSQIHKVTISNSIISRGEKREKHFFSEQRLLYTLVHKQERKISILTLQICTHLNLLQLLLTFEHHGRPFWISRILKNAQHLRSGPQRIMYLYLMPCQNLKRKKLYKSKQGCLAWRSDYCLVITYNISWKDAENSTQISTSISLSKLCIP